MSYTRLSTTRMITSFWGLGLTAALVAAVYKALQTAKTQLNQGQGNLANHLKEGDQVLLVIAHPDDECMFFAPTVRFLSRLKIPVHLLCLTSGNYEGLGKVRKHELEASCRVLGIASCVILEQGNIVDGPGNWDIDLVAESIASFFKDFKDSKDITHVLSFDRRGVSGHPNHCDASRAVRLFASTRSTADLTVVELESVPLYLKYLGAFNVIYEYVRESIYTASAEGTTAVQRAIALMPPGEYYGMGWGAMRQHRSQLVWFRFLYLLFSRYLHINTLYVYRPILKS